MAWTLFSNSWESTWLWNNIQKIFPSKHKAFGIIGKIIWFRSTFNKELRVNSDVTRRYRMSMFFKQCGWNRKIKVIRLYSENYYYDFWISFIKKWFFIQWKRFFHRMIFFNSRFTKNSYIFLKQDHQTLQNTQI